MIPKRSCKILGTSKATMHLNPRDKYTYLLTLLSRVFMVSFFFVSPFVKSSLIYKTLLDRICVLRHRLCPRYSLFAQGSGKGSGWIRRLKEDVFLFINNAYNIPFHYTPATVNYRTIFLNQEYIPVQYKLMHSDISRMSLWRVFLEDNNRSSFT